MFLFERNPRSTIKKGRKAPKTTVVCCRTRLIGLGIELDITEEAFENIRRGMGHSSEISQE